jgi:2-dehydro-3-deoxyphosphogluconate aldolase/(4S)-4-hydroxy-2-oxoglutarate aldolase
MTREQVRASIESTGIIPAIRVHSAEEAIFASNAVFEGGIPVAEITMTIPGALEAISELARRSPDFVVGAGTVVDLDAARCSIDAGACFITSPGLDPEIMEFVAQKNAVCIPGALTPTEVLKASRSCSDLIKIFPCAQVGGPSYIRALKRPFPEISLVASGGVTQKTAGDFIRAGAIALGIGEDLIPPEAVRLRNVGWICELCRRFLAMVQEARSHAVHPGLFNDSFS